VLTVWHRVHLIPPVTIKLSHTICSFYHISPISRWFCFNLAPSRSTFGPLSRCVDRLTRRTFVLLLFINLSIKTIFIISHPFLNGFTSILHRLEAPFTLFLDAVTALCAAHSLSCYSQICILRYWFFLFFSHVGPVLHVILSNAHR